MRKTLMFTITSIFILIMLIGCSKDGKQITPSKYDDANNEFNIDLSTWDEVKVYAFLDEVNEYIREIPVETTSKEQIIRKYEKYFSPELSEKIFDSLYMKNENGWRVPDGDAGYIFFVPRGEYEGSKVVLEYNKDYIRIRETYEIGMYSAIEYIIRIIEKPVISEWNQSTTFEDNK